MEKIRHDLRLSEAITPFGVGAITDLREESLMAPDTSWWDTKSAPEIHCARLMARLGAGVLRQPPTHSGPAGKETAALPYWRFPAWRFCERCDKLSKLTGRKKGKWDNHCGCGGLLVPMRFVAVCEKGSHIQDVPWFQWVHRGHEASRREEVRVCRAYNELHFRKTASHGEGLGSLTVKCHGCGNLRPLSELAGKGALHRDGIRCAGRQPWEPEEQSGKEPCPHRLVAVQRGATGNYIAEQISALDIPEERPQSTVIADNIRGHRFFDKVVADNGGPQSEMVAGWIAEELGATAEVVLAIAASKEASADELLLDLKDGEWAAFLKKLQDGRDHSGGDFVVDGNTLDETHGPNSLLQSISGIGQVRRVREVRALRGFQRYDANAATIRADLGPNQYRYPTYPSVEMFGEGIFIRFDESKLAEWESLPDVQDRASILKRRRANLDWASNRLDAPEPRYIALHTLSHLLIRRLAFESGYASAALQERIYANPDRTDKTAGILIYTAAGDAQGTLGGLVRLGEPKKLIDLLVSALEDADFCSNDPVCIESDSQGASQLNLSACHGCSLVSETSCETANRLLDRQLVLGGSDVHGLLHGALREIRTVPTERQELV
ncbi:DrmB family protein [Saccharopolyspora sp. CA-218241]|uniref:DrmB family protein n=1 Tax=Saccharopolyspora sp. CA-218241 TaxID=3240027 RepID=UPI003D95321F